MSLSKPDQQLISELTCPICLQIFSDPMVLPCGHNYCLACIQRTFESQSVASCPECRVVYGGMESVQRNLKLVGIVAGYRASAPPFNDSPGPTEAPGVFCDQCIDSDTLAVKMCLKCEVALCARHLQRHGEKESFRGHRLMDTQGDPGVRGCAAHRCPLEYFCSTDMKSLCATCFTEGTHQNHDVLTFDVAEEEMRRALEGRSKVVSCRLQMTANLLQVASEEQNISQSIGDKLVHKAISVMDNMASLVASYRERLSVLLEEETGLRTKCWEHGLSILREQHQKLLRAQTNSTQVLHETDRCMFIDSFLQVEPELREAITAPFRSKIPSREPLNTQRLQAGLRTQNFCSELSRMLESLQVLLNPLELTFNLCTAHSSLVLSNDLRTVKFSAVKQPYADHGERFSSAPQVLCAQSFSGGEHSWVVEVAERSMWGLGLCYKGIPRRGDHSRLGHNNSSWRLQWKNKKLTACHASANVVLSEVTSAPVRVEVSLDYEGGTLAFHSVKGKREHLHTFKAVFREPVYPAFSIHSNTKESWITLQSGV